MQYDMHSEYPVILRQTDEGVIGTWYENRFKDPAIILKELEAYPDLKEKVAKIHEYAATHGGKMPEFKHKVEIFSRVRHLASITKGYNPFDLVELTGPAYFEPLSHPEWAVSGESTIEWDIPDDRDDTESKFSMQLDGTVLKSLSAWNVSEEQWLPVDKIFIPFNTLMTDKIVGFDLVPIIV